MMIHRFDFQPATASDARDIHEIMLEAKRSLENDNLFMISNESRIIEKLTTDCWGWVVFDATSERKPIAYYLFQQPSRDNSEDNLGFEIGLNGTELEKVLILDTVAVLPAYRGFGLQSALSALGEAEGKRRGLKHFMATVHPDNVFSLRNFLSTGYSIIVEKQMYGSVGTDGELGVRGLTSQDGAGGGVPRYILHKYVGS